MKKSIYSMLVICLSLFLATSGFAAEGATKEECIAKAKEAAAMVNELGAEAAYAKINDPKGPFVWKNTYVFALTADTASITAHPFKPGLIGKNLLGIKDVNGKMFFAEFVEVAQSGTGAGWVSYMWPKPEEKKPSPKISYIYRVPGENLAMGAGIYE
jgi:cytochrome c